MKFNSLQQAMELNYRATQLTFTLKNSLNSKIKFNLIKLFDRKVRQAFNKWKLDT